MKRNVSLHFLFIFTKQGMNDPWLLCSVTPIICTIRRPARKKKSEAATAERFGLHQQLLSKALRWLKAISKPKNLLPHRKQLKMITVSDRRVNREEMHTESDNSVTIWVETVLFKSRLKHKHSVVECFVFNDQKKQSQHVSGISWSDLPTKGPCLM